MSTVASERPQQSAGVLDGSGLDPEAVLKDFRAIEAPIDRYIFLRNLKTSNLNAFFRLLVKHADEMLPFVYTPTVGEACQRYHTLPLKTWGLYISYADKGNILAKLKAQGQQDVKVAVVTDGERILGLGDLGTNGMGISEGKIMLYSVAAGVNPRRCLPICLDVGTENQALLDDSAYPGLRQKRVRGAEYDAFVDEFITALKAWQPHMLLQFEDFGNTTAFHILNKYRSDFCCFNDDIQGTACVCLAAVESAIRVTGKKIDQQRFLFLGAGEAGTGIGDLMAEAISMKSGKTMEEARKHCHFIDSKGLVVKGRAGLQEHKLLFAHEGEPLGDLLECINALKPTALIGVSKQPGAFTKAVVEAMCAHNERPVIFPLSNPTHLSECTFADALRWSDGKVLFASGSPFPPARGASGVLLHPAQANNAYVFPALGHAAVITRAKNIPLCAFVTAAEALASQTTEDDVNTGRLFPSFDNIHAASRKVMIALCEYFEGKGLSQLPPGQDWPAVVDASFWSHDTPGKL